MNIRCCGPTIIIGEKTGINYTAQCNGCSCSHRSLEGYILPFDIGDDRHNLFFNPRWWYDQYGYSNKSIVKFLNGVKDYSSKVDMTYKELDSIFRSGSANGNWGDDLKKWYHWQEFVEFIQDLYESFVVTVDQDKEQIEAWIHVHTKFGPGILTWNNCD